MSALTNLFTALANKIRSKTGGSDTYTPPQMVNAIDDVYQAGVNAGTTPTQTKTVTAGTSATTVTPDTGYALSSVTVNPTPTETKSDTPNVSTNKTVSPSSGKYLSQVTIQPLTHSGTYTPAANTAQNDMGAYHDKRYVNTSGMIVPSGNKSITANGTGIDVSSYATANVNVPNPTLSGNATAADVKSGKTFYGSNYTKQTGTYVEPTITSITPSNTSPAAMSANSNYQPSTSGYAIQSYSDVNLTTYGQSVRIGGGIKKVTINTQEIPSAFIIGGSVESITPSNSSPVSISSGNFYKSSANGYAISSYDNVTPTADGTYFANGMKNMSQPGWVYSQKPTPVETVLWTNPSPSSNFAAQTVTLNGTILDYDFVKFYVDRYKDAGTNQLEFIFPVSVFTSVARFVLGGNSSSTTFRYRGVSYSSSSTSSETKIYFNDNKNGYGGTETNNSGCIPRKIVGVKLP